jgi:serine/threonine-protein kinase
MTPAPTYGPAPGAYQNQSFSQPPFPAPGSVPPQPPPINPQKRNRGTLPAIQVASVTPQMPPVVPNPPTTPMQQRPGTIPLSQTGAFASPPVQPPPPQRPRIMVQYPQVGSKLAGARGTYEVMSILGSGEFGAVYECIGPFDQTYAVKMVRPANRPYSEVHAEWSKEVQRLVSLRHPNVVYIYDSFTQDHLFYLALERCEHALKDMLGTPMQEGLVLEISRQLLAAVQFLHDNDVVHDDLHAGNVLITHATDRPTVKISDFGISHELRGMNAVRPNVVHHAIMAPEILAHGFTTRQSDLYQVGLLLFWMVTGESAINLDVPYQELVRQVAEGEPRQRAEQIGTPLGHLIAKMLRRREAFRFTSAREVWAEMRELDAWKQRDLFPTK